MQIPNPALEYAYPFCSDLGIRSHLPSENETDTVIPRAHREIPPELSYVARCRGALAFVI